MKLKGKISPAQVKLAQQIQQHKKDLLTALEASLGIVTTACKKVGVDRGTYYRYYNEDEAFRAKVDELDNIAIDFAESKLFKEIEQNNITAIIFFLKCRAKKRGYVERQELSGPEGKDLIPTRYDMSKLTDKELQALKIMQAKMEIKDE